MEIIKNYQDWLKDEMKSTKYLWTIVILALAVYTGYKLGRASRPIGKEYKVSLPEVVGSISVPEPVFSGVPSPPVWPLRVDTIRPLGDTVFVIDTVEVMADYPLLKQYAFNVFDDEKGSLDVSLSTRYNALQSFDYTFKGVKTIQRVEKRFIPFGSLTYHSYGAVGAGGGFFWNSFGVEYLYNLPTKPGLSGYHTIGLKIKL